MGAPATDLLSVDLLDHDLFADHEPWEVFDLLQREAPVYHHPEPDGRGFWALTKYDDVVAVLRDTKTFSSEVGGAATIEDLPEDVLAARRNFLEFDPPKHGRYRRLISTQLHPGRGRAVRAVAARPGPAPARPVRWRSANSTSCTSSRRRSRFACWPTSSACPRRSCPRLIELGDRLLVDTDPEYVGELAFAAEREEDRYKPFGSPWADELCAIGREYYEDRRRCPRDDVLTLIANAEIDGQPLSRQDLDNMFALLIVAGNETTRQAISLGTLALAGDPDEYERLRHDRALIASATEELLRYSSPVWFFRRTATARRRRPRTSRSPPATRSWCGSPPATAIPDHYPDPHRLDVGRNPTDHLTFGRGGPHQCLGAHLARLELRVYLEELVARVERIELAGEPVRQRSNFTNGLKRLPVRVTLA